MSQNVIRRILSGFERREVMESSVIADNSSMVASGEKVGGLNLRDEGIIM